MENETIGGKILALRKKKGDTQAELGAYLNISSQAVSKWERGESYPDFLTVSRLAKYFNVPLNYFEEDVQGEQAVAFLEESPQEAITVSEELPQEEMRECPFCGKPTPISERFCKHCDGYIGISEEQKAIQKKAAAKKAAEQQKEAAQKKAEQQKAMASQKTCGNCGKSMPKSAIYCPHCNAMGGIQSIKSCQGSASTFNGWAVAALICSICVTWILGLILGFIGLKKAKETGTGIGMCCAAIIISIIGGIIGILMAVSIFSAGGFLSYV